MFVDSPSDLGAPHLTHSPYARTQLGQIFSICDMRIWSCNSFLSTVICRLGTNLPWKGRQTLCKHYQNQDIQSDTLLKICRATTPLDFRLLFSQVIDGSQRQRSDTKARHRPQKPLHTRTSLEVLSTQSLSAIGQRQRTAKITETLKLHRSARVFSPSKSTRRHSQQAALNSVSGDWHLQLASHCYESDIQWHVNHLADCLRQTKEIGKQPKAINKAKTVRSESDSLEYRQLLKTYFDREAENDNVCNIRIDINGIINRPSSESIGRPAGVQSTDWPDDSSEPAAIVSQPHNDTTMNATIDAINPNHIHQFALHSVAQTFDRQLQYSHNTSGAETAPVYSESSHIDNIIQSLCTLNIDANEYQQQQQRVLPQIVLTDCSSDSRASFDVANSIIATGVAGIASTAKNNNNNNIRFVAVAGAESAHRSTATTIVDSCTSDIIGTAHHSSLLLSLPSTHSQHNGCLTIPDAIYYRSESRPP